jgi:hypothetical protein
MLVHMNRLCIFIRHKHELHCKTSRLSCSLKSNCFWLAMSNGLYHRRRIVLTLPFSPLLATTQTPMTPQMKATQAAELPRRRGREPAPAVGTRRAAAPAAAPSRKAAAVPAPPLPAQQRTLLPTRPLNSDYACQRHRSL